MPSTFLIEDSLEFVARYQYAGADEAMTSASQVAMPSAQAVTLGKEQETPTTSLCRSQLLPLRQQLQGASGS